MDLVVELARGDVEREKDASDRVLDDLESLVGRGDKVLLRRHRRENGERDGGGRVAPSCVQSCGESRQRCKPETWRCQGSTEVSSEGPPLD